MSKITGQTIIIGMCIIGATVIASTGNNGWGWLVAIAILVML
jgi:hypothetical protein